MSKEDNEIDDMQIKREDIHPTWLQYWNPGNRAEFVDCGVAFQTIYWCLSPANQIRNLYRTGMLADCKYTYK